MQPIWPLYGGCPRPWANLLDELAGADVVISTTGAQQPIVMAAQFATIRRREDSPLFLLDLAVPRDFEPAIGQQAGIHLFSLDDLQDACQRNQAAPEGTSASHADHRAGDGPLHDGFALYAAGPVIKRLKEAWDVPKNQELERLLNRLPQLDETRRDIRESFDGLTNKLFHPPLESLRVEARQGASNICWTLSLGCFTAATGPPRNHRRCTPGPAMPSNSACSSEVRRTDNLPQVGLTRNACILLCP